MWKGETHLLGVTVIRKRFDSEPPRNGACQAVGVTPEAPGSVRSRGRGGERGQDGLLWLPPERGGHAGQPGLELAGLSDLRGLWA